ncbi:MAG: hypothetical protein AAGA46_01455 [Cyanobacteria bacterium P01_F01_bin.13]
MKKRIKSGLATLVAVISLANCGTNNQISNDFSSKAGIPMERTAVADSATILTTQESEIAPAAPKADTSSPVEPPNDVAL